MEKAVAKIKYREKLLKDDQGFVLIFSLLALVMVSLCGLWALKTATYELKIAANEQAMGSNFNVSEGGALLEGANVGFVPGNTP